MALGRTRRRTGGCAAWLGALLLAAGLSACNGPVEAYRSLTGMNKNDPDPATAPYATNLDKAESGAYPNLASVPEPPIIASTTAERQKLAENLTGERGSAESNGGSAKPGPVPPPPSVPSSIAAPEMAALPPVVPQPQTPVSRLRAQDEPPLPSPPETTMQTPVIAGAPGAEPPRPGPAPAQPSAIPRPMPSALPSAAAASGNPLPAPPVAVLPPPQVSPQVAALPPPKLPPTPVVVAALDIAPGSTALPSDTSARLADVATQYKQRPGTVRVVSYAAPAVGAAEQLNSFRTALDRAQIVAKQLADAGVPANKIQTEAAPSSAGSPTGHIEVQLLR
jgi:hypothetical protein